MRYTITAALPYTNGPIHIGHLAGVYIPADIYVRYLRQKKQDVIYICGSDEHGVAISMRARKEGVSPKEIIDKYHKTIKDSFREFGISFDNYARTSDSIHYQTASEFFKKMYDENQFEEINNEQLYDSDAKQFLADRFIIGTCPKCHSPEAYGDQCESCGTSLNSMDLIDPKSTITGKKPILKKTKHWFLPLNKYSDFLKEWILKGHKKDWKSNVYGQVKSWIDDGLKPRAVTRDLDWGIPVPLDDVKGKVLYVWFDAPIGYISSTKQWADRENKDWEPYWKDKDTKLVHFIGKDNIVFHCVIFPTMLKSHGDYILPENVPANEFLNLEGQKLSTSKNWAVWLHEYLEDFPDKQDVLRYALMTILPETKDSDFTWKDFQAKNENELVAIFGNFFNRVTVLTHKYYEGIVPEPLSLKDLDNVALQSIKDFPEKISKSIEQYRFREAAQELMNVARLGNKYLAEEEPWKIIKTNPERVQTVMYVALQIAGTLTSLSQSFLPFTANKMQKILNIPSYDWEEILTRELLPKGHRINETVLLFGRIEDDQIQMQKDKLEATKKENKSCQKKRGFPQKEEITFEDFSKMDIRIGTICEAKKMPKADKLLILKIDVGLDIRTVISGIAEHYSPKDIIGKRVTVLLNLKPRKLRGFESQGMVLTTETKDGKIDFVQPEDDNVPNGKIVS